MLRSRFTALLTASLAMTLILAVGCAKKDDAPSTSKGTPETGPKDAPSSKTKSEVASTGTGTIEGKIMLDGPKPAVEMVKMEKDTAYCESAKDDLDKAKPLWRVGADSGVGNVVVWVRAGKNKFFKLSDADKKRTDAVVVDQPFCAFEPHIFVVYPSYFDGKKQAATGQKLKVVNDAMIAHNSNITFADPLINKDGQNKQLAAKMGDKVDFIEVACHPSKDSECSGEARVDINCNVHTWMNAHGYVLDHPFYAVTSGGKKGDKDFGNFKIENVPAGAELELVYWHESMQKPMVYKKIKVESGKTLKIDDIKVMAK